MFFLSNPNKPQQPSHPGLNLAGLDLTPMQQLLAKQAERPTMRGMG